MKIIDADKLHYKQVYIQTEKGSRPALVVFAKEIRKMPEIVRCKDCRWSCLNNCEWLITMADNDFHMILQGQEIWTRTVIREKIQLYTHIEKARSDAFKNSLKLYCIAHKRESDAEMLITMPLHDWMSLYREFELSQSLPKEEQ